MYLILLVIPMNVNSLSGNNEFMIGLARICKTIAEH